MIEKDGLGRIVDLEEKLGPGFLEVGKRVRIWKEASWRRRPQMRYVLSRPL